LILILVLFADFWIRIPFRYPSSSYFVLDFVEETATKSLSLRRFKSDCDEIWQYCSPAEYASTDGVT